MGFDNVHNLMPARAGECSALGPGSASPASSWNQGTCGVGLIVGCMVSKLYEYAFTGAGVGLQTSPFGGQPPYKTG